MTTRQPRLQRQWQFDWRLLVFAGVFLPLLTSLGLWQLGRAEQKEQMLTRWHQLASREDWGLLSAAPLAVGHPVELDGQFADYSWLLDNRTRDGVAGYEVLTLFRPDNGPPVVINRGWVRAPARRDILPVVPTPVGRVHFSGRVSDYPEPPVLNAAGQRQEDWPRRVQSLSVEEVRALSPAVAGQVIRMSGADQPGAFRADWAPDRMGPQTHYGYALQWFSLAVALIVLTVVASYRRTGADNDNDNG